MPPFQPSAMVDMLRGKGTRFYGDALGLTSSPTTTDRGEGKQQRVAQKNGRRGCVRRRGAVVGVFDEQREQGSSGVFRCGVNEQMVEGIAALRRALVGSFLVVSGEEN